MKTSPSSALLPKVHPGLHLVAGLGEDEARLGNPVNGEGGASQPRNTSRQTQSRQETHLHVVSILGPSTRLREIKMFVSDCDLRQRCVDSSTIYPVCPCPPVLHPALRLADDVPARPHEVKAGVLLLAGADHRAAVLSRYLTGQLLLKLN